MSTEIISHPETTRECETEYFPPATWTIVAVVILGLLAVATTWGQYEAEHDKMLLTLDIAATIVGCVLVPLVVRQPVVGASLAALLAAVSPAATPTSTAGTLYVAQRRPFRIAAAIAAFGAIAHVVRAVWRPPEGISLIWWVALVLIAHAALLAWGALSRSRQALVGSLRERARRAEAEQGRRVAEARAAERNQIAREMHDVLAHRLSLLATYSGALEYRPDSSPERISEAAGIIRTGVHQALDELRDVISVLRAGTDSTEVPQPTMVDVPKLIAEARGTGTVVEYEDDTGSTEPIPAIGRTAFRVVQEGLTNARKHAPNSAVAVTLRGRVGGHLNIDVVNALDDGPIAGDIPGAGSGLIGLTERVRLVGGILDHRIDESGSFALHAELPWAP